MVTYAASERVYRPQADTIMLVGALRRMSTLRGARVVDLCTGSGIVGVAAALLGAREVVAVDTEPTAVEATRALAERKGVGRAVTALHRRIADLSDPAYPFDVITANPPYMPVPTDPSPHLHPPGPSHCWDAGPDGRDVLDELCMAAPKLLAAAGTLLLVQSEVADIVQTRRKLHIAGMDTQLVDEALVPFGPVMAARASWLRTEGLMDPDSATERLVVIAAQRRTC